MDIVVRLKKWLEKDSIVARNWGENGWSIDGDIEAAVEEIERLRGHKMTDTDGKGWIGVDLDGTLASYDGWIGPEYIGEPIPEMLERVKKWLRAGKIVKIFSARCSVPEQLIPVKKWLWKHGLGELEITNIKDHTMIELWDDRCVQVITNSGKPISTALNSNKQNCTCSPVKRIGVGKFCPDCGGRNSRR